MVDKIGDYKIVGKLGEGGMGEVYKGIDEMLEREVAIKLLRPELSNRPDIVGRFRTEAIALGRLNHPCIATVYSFAQYQNQYYIALEFVRGETLDQVLRRRGRLPWQEAVLYASQALEGLEHAHRLNIVHRDIKPSNLMLTHDGCIKLMDFGIARILERGRQTKAGYLIGTLEYMSPEQAQGLEADARSDFYSLGVLLYEMLTGHLPFEKSTDYDLIKAHAEEIPQPPRQWVQEIPNTLNKTVMRALQKEPKQRFSSASEFSLALKKLLDQSPPASQKKTTNLAYPLLASLWKNYPFPVTVAGLLPLIGFIMALWPPTNPDVSTQFSTQNPTQNSSIPEMVQIPDRTFMMGKYEVTREQFAAFLNETGYNPGSTCWTSEYGEAEERSGRNWLNPDFTQDRTHPVVCVSLKDAQAYADWLSRKTGKHYRLPTKTEWEYVARAGTQTVLYWDNKDSKDCRYEVAHENLKQAGWSGSFLFCDNGYIYTAPVGLSVPNNFGLYGMLSNVFEWTCSVTDQYNGKDRNCVSNNENEAMNLGVFRDDSWLQVTVFVRPGLLHYRDFSTFQYSYLGFRLAQD